MLDDFGIAAWRADLWLGLVRLFHEGREGWFNLGTPNQATAAAKARDIFVHLKANGWDATLAQFKSGPAHAPNKMTVGAYLAAVNATNRIEPRTFLNYENCLRSICAGTFGIRDSADKFDYRAGGNKAWREKIDAIRLERLTPDRVRQWQKDFVAAAGKSPAAIVSARRTVNSYVRCARSLFSAKRKNGQPSLLDDALKRLHGATLPSPLPFTDVGLFEAGSMKYKSKIDVRALVAAAKNELKVEVPECYKVFLLALFAGMRRAEIDGCEWRMVDFANNVIHLEETEWLHRKTDESAGEISLDAEVSAELRALKAVSQSPFVIASDRPPRHDSLRPYYRSEEVFDQLTAWLRKKGIRSNKPIHELRKEIGARIATAQGIYAASRFLRHSDITTTARHYADPKKRICAGLGNLLETEIKSAPGQAAGGAA